MGDGNCALKHLKTPLICIWSWGALGVAGQIHFRDWWTCSFDARAMGRGMRQLSQLRMTVLLQVYQSLEQELQRHVSRQDTLQQCQAWLSAIQPDLQPSPHPPLSRAEAVKQVLTFMLCYVTHSDIQWKHVKYSLCAKLGWLLGHTLSYWAALTGLRRKCILQILQQEDYDSLKAQIIAFLKISEK